MAICFLVAACAALQSFATPPDYFDSAWDMKSLETPPVMEHVASLDIGRIRAIFFAGEPWQGKPTKVFAYYGAPKGVVAGERVPGVICVHGGGATAFPEWVRIWNERGFAAIAIDTNGNMPAARNQNNPTFERHAWAGPPPRGFDQAERDPRDQWPYHAVGAIIRAHSLLRSLPEVDSSNIGVTGISWGGFLTSIVAGVDPRFKFAIPVYGCGFVHEGNSWNREIDAYGRERWVALWDPSAHLGRATLDMLWVNGTNDPHYDLPLFQKSYRLPRGDRRLAVRVGMPHGHRDGWTPPEIYAFANSAVGRGAPLVEVGRPVLEGGRAGVHFNAASGVEVVSAQCSYTTDVGVWLERTWETIGGTIDRSKNSATAKLPANVTACFFNLQDARGLVSSSEHTAIR